ncbi:DUF317 domain-containing protein [Streptomyces beigongshangae]|uniref:DUF317 domain-containing protein n=1 Tax=Streptomyces beigongshangae TaxID=2841597 RepID=UPI001C8589B3|nr:DUF317 domain-containing protein [Streptomyces sp. REN17]
MSTAPSINAHVGLNTHPHHPSAVVATVTGSAWHIAQAHLSVRGFESVSADTLVMARIDREEPYWAQRAADALTAERITVEITPQLREAINEEWTWPDYPMSWCTRSEIREVSNEAQKIHDDIRHGRLIVHAHAHDGWTTKAVGSYRDGSSVVLHGENHLRTVETSFPTAAEALVAFDRVHGDAMRPGPPTPTDVERQADEALNTLRTAAFVEAEPTLPRIETVPAYAADPADPDATLEAFVNEHREWAKWRTWSDHTTHLVHDPDPRETAWTFAAYETPVSDRMWHLTLTAATPDPLLQSLLISLAHGDAWDTALGSPVIERTVSAATRSLTDAGWKHTIDGRHIRWQTPHGDAGVQFDVFAAQDPRIHLPTWTLWAGLDVDRPTWAIHASRYTPAPLLAALTEDLAHGTGTRQTRTTRTEHRKNSGITAPTVPPAAAGPAAGRIR